jgi:spore germination protein GerM
MRTLIFPLTLLSMVILACAFPGQATPPVQVSPEMVTLTVYFTDAPRYQIGTEPYEAAVSRTVPEPTSLPEAVLTQLFLGPTEAEKAQGLTLVLSGTTGYSKLTIENGIARVYLTGTCASLGATYTIANLIYANMAQFPEIQSIKIYDQNNETEMPDGPGGSIPFCLEP